GNNLIFGDAGADTITSGGGNDTIQAGTEDDLVSSGGGNDLVVGDAGNDTVNAGAGNDVVQGDFGDDVINGGAGDDLLIGARGDDTIHGDAGNDIIWGGFEDFAAVHFNLGDPANFTNPIGWDAAELDNPSGFTPPRITPDDAAGRALLRRRGHRPALRRGRHRLPLPGLGAGRRFRPGAAEHPDHRAAFLGR